MNPKHLQTLELDKILERLGAFASFSASREMIRAQQPEVDSHSVKSMLAATTEARRLLAGRPQLSVGAARDVRPLVRRTELGAILSPAEFLEIAGTIDSSRTWHELLHKGQLMYPRLALHLGRLHALVELRQEITRTINEHGEVVDHASPLLARLRAEVRAGRERLLRRLEAIISDPNNAEAVQEPIVTERNGRYVLAIKAGYRGHVRGVVHDQSESGATLFIEPLVAVEMMNEWRQHQLDEEREVERILRVLSRQVSLQAYELGEIVEALASLDCAIARARYAETLDAMEPEIDNDGQLSVVDGRHPLLTGSVVPQSIQLGQDYLVLVITGPNTGGKTVALKTVGLLTLMAQCGMHIPAAPGSRLAIFEEVLADIGDEQSIEQSLSTFSSHMRTIAGILQSASERTLVLLDELGAGTDPTEGAALAQAILDYLVQRKARTIATTHYSELKTYAHVREGVENASVEFDVNTLAPTYRLRVGTPGRSNALAIATRLGIPVSILEEAQREIPEEHQQVETLLEGIRRKERTAARDRNRAARQQQHLTRIRASTERALAEAEHIREQAREQTYAEAEAELGELRREAARLRQELDRQRNDHQAIRSLQQDISTASEQLMRLRPDSAMPVTPPAAIEIGQAVQVPSFSEPGQVLSQPDNKGEVEVQVGAFHVRVPAAELRSTHRRAPSEGGITFQPSARQPHSPHALANPLDLRGLRADEVEPLLDRELNKAFSSRVPYIRIIHGHGTGVVRKIVRDFLAHQSYVSSYEPAPQSDGGDGVTIVILAL